MTVGGIIYITLPVEAQCLCGAEKKEEVGKRSVMKCPPWKEEKIALFH